MERLSGHAFFDWNAESESSLRSRRHRHYSRKLRDRRIRRAENSGVA
jgi:hypothetical protein